MLDTDQLRSFVAIIDTGSFTRAAERVNKTQSAVSMQIRRLEEVLGRPLFVKQGRGVRLSDDGEKLVDYARQMLQLEAAAFASVSHKALAGRVRLGIPDDYADTFLPEIVTRFMRRHPLVEMSVVCEGSQALGERVSMRDIDMAIITDCGSLKGAEVAARGAAALDRRAGVLRARGAAAAARPIGPDLRVASRRHRGARRGRHRLAAVACVLQPGGARARGAGRASPSRCFRNALSEPACGFWRRAPDCRRCRATVSACWSGPAVRRRRPRLRRRSAPRCGTAHDRSGSNVQPTSCSRARA